MKTLVHLVSATLLIAGHSDLHAAVPAGKTQQLTTPDQVPKGLAKSDWTSIREAHTRTTVWEVYDFASAAVDQQMDETGAALRVCAAFRKVN